MLLISDVSESIPRLLRILLVLLCSPTGCFFVVDVVVALKPTIQIGLKIGSSYPTCCPLQCDALVWFSQMLLESFSSRTFLQPVGIRYSLWRDLFFECIIWFRDCVEGLGRD
eukprot:gene6380-4605_t